MGCNYGEREADDELDDSEYPDDSDFDDDETDVCPHCGESIYDDSEKCPYCGKYLSSEDAPRHRPWWVVAGVGLSLVVVVRWILLRG